VFELQRSGKQFVYISGTSKRAAAVDELGEGSGQVEEVVGVVKVMGKLAAMVA